VTPLGSLQDALARLIRAQEARCDGDDGFVDAILDDLISDLVAAIDENGRIEHGEKAS